MADQKSQIGGIIPPVVSPFTHNLEFDTHAYKRIINHVIEGGVNGIFILGTNGECACLSDEIRHKAISTAVASADRRVPVFVNVSTASFIESLKLAEIAADQGADYIVISPPFYFEMDQDELYRYFDLLASRSSLPVFMYNAPLYTKIEIALGTVSKLALHENIRGIKDSSCNIRYLHDLLNAREDREFNIFVGDELLLGECISHGGDGGIHGGANVFPELYVKMYRAIVNRDVEKQKKLQKIIERVHSQIYDVSDSPMKIIIGLKYALSVLGICSDTMAMPVYARLSDKQKKTIGDFIGEFNQYAI